MARLKLSPPWIRLYKEIDALFSGDDDILVVYDDENIEVKLYVQDLNKADALASVLPATREFGGAKLRITVIPPNEDMRTTIPSLNNEESVFRTIFANNANVNSTRTINTPFGVITYVVFQKEVVQYFEDNLSSYYGICSTLYESIARDVFVETNNVFFCTYDGSFHF